MRNLLCLIVQTPPIHGGMECNSQDHLFYLGCNSRRRGSGQGSHVDPAKDTDVEKQLESHQLKLSFYGVPEQLVDSYKKR